MRRFYCETINTGTLPRDSFPQRESTHLRKVLRASAGDRVILLDGHGALGEAAVGEDGELFVEKISRVPRPRLKLRLFSAAPAKHALDHMLRQCAEVGVWSVHLIATERSVAKPSGKTAFERMRRIIIEGCKQSGNPWFPEIENKTIPFSEMLVRLKSMKQSYFGATRTNTREANPPPQHSERDTNVAWIVGPEGGFTESEEKLLAKAGAIPLSLGPWTLRIETAAVIGSHHILSPTK